MKMFYAVDAAISTYVDVEGNGCFKLEAVSQISASAILEFLDSRHPISLLYPYAVACEKPLEGALYPVISPEINTPNCKKTVSVRPTHLAYKPEPGPPFCQVRI